MAISTLSVRGCGASTVSAVGDTIVKVDLVENLLQRKHSLRF
jgi:hypothetical protein